MGLEQKKDEREVVDGVEVIERSDVPDDLPEAAYDLVEGASAEDIAAERDDEVVEEASTAEVRDDAEEEPQDADVNEVEVEPAADGEQPASADEAPTPVAEHADASKKRHTMYIAIAVVAVIVAAIGGYFFGSGGFGAKGAGSATLTEGQLDAPVASFNFNGATTKISARDAIESQYSLDAVKGADGTYPAPSGEMILGYARNKILVSEAESRGLSVSDDQLKEYAEGRLGTSDFKAIAENYGVNEDQAKQIVRDNALVGQLYEQIVPKASEAPAPEAPVQPADGNTTAPTKDYAEYIIGLLGKNWDSEKGAWANEDNEFFSALKGSTFTPEGASYEDAQTAFYVAYELYASQAQEANKAWTLFANDLYAKADVELYGLFV